MEDTFSCEVLGTRGGVTWPDAILTKPYGNDVQRKKIRIEKSSLASVAELIHFTALIEGNEKAIIPAQQSVELIGIIEGLYKSAITRQKINF